MHTNEDENMWVGYNMQYIIAVTREQKFDGYYNFSYLLQLFDIWWLLQFLDNVWEQGISSHY